MRSDALAANSIFIKNQTMHELSASTNFANYNEGYVLFYFTAAWCGPCQAVYPALLELEAAFPNVVFVKVDVDRFDDIAAKEGVTCMPTFVYKKNDTIIGRCEGADVKRVKDLLACS